MSRVGPIGPIEGGRDTARLSASEQDRIHRQERQDAARSYLDRRGLQDVAVVLGFVPEQCEACGEDVPNSAGSGGYCPSKDCQAVKLRTGCRPARRRAGAA